MGTVMSGVADRHIHGEGTPECLWRDSTRLKSLAPIPLAALAPPGTRVVVVAPHPDDEVLGCGGALALLARAGHDVVVVGVTDGEGSHPGSRRWTPAQLGAVRRAERADGLARLGVRAASVALGIADGGVTRAERKLSDRLTHLLRPGDAVFTTWRLDGHPDHEAAGRAAVAAATACRAHCWEVPVWMWHWAAPADPRVPWSRLRRLALDAEACERKARAIAAHSSQLVASPAQGHAAVLPDWALARLLRRFEVFIPSEPLL